MIKESDKLSFFLNFFVVIYYIINMDKIEIVNYFVSEENFVIYYKRNGSILMTFVDLSKVYEGLSNESFFIKRLVNYYLSSSTSDILKEEFDFFLKRLVKTPEELNQELYEKYGVNLGNKDAYLFSINRDISYMIQDKWRSFSRARDNISDNISSIKKIAREVGLGLSGLDINDFLQSLAVNALRKGLTNKVLDRIPLEYKNSIKPEYIEKSLPYLYDDVLFSESVAELYLFDEYVGIKKLFDY